MDGPTRTLPFRRNASHHDWCEDALATRTPRMRALCVLASSNQLYSGIGRNLFELAIRLANRVDYEFVIDDHFSRNVEILRRFCDRHGHRLHVLRARLDPDHCDPIPEGLPDLLHKCPWDAIELVGWANSGTHQEVLDHVDDVVIGYTPHHQPLWTVAMSPKQAEHVAQVHQRLMERADVVCCDSPAERRRLQAQAPQRDNATFVPLGCDFRVFGPGLAPRQPQLLFVGDLAEPRKRFDRVLWVFQRLLPGWPELRLVVIGNRSEELSTHLPDSVRNAIELRGYVSEAELRQTYAQSRGLLLLSDYEAFGIPILEALACATPVFLSRQETTESLFGAFRGAHFCPADDLSATLAIIEHVLQRGDQAIRDAWKDRAALEATFDWSVAARRKASALASAWYRRHRWAWTA